MNSSKLKKPVKQISLLTNVSKLSRKWLILEEPRYLPVRKKKLQGSSRILDSSFSSIFRVYEYMHHPIVGEAIGKNKLR